MTAISLQSVNKQFGDTEVIKQVQLEIEDGEFTVFVGPSGCGKSTLLRLIAGLEDLSHGNIHFDKQNVTHLPPAQRGVAMVFQSYALYPHMSVFNNMAFGLKLAKEDPKNVKQRVEEAAQILQIDHLLQRKPKELSGGQRQRVAIGRAIVRNPRVFLFDEPLSNLDAALRVQMRIELKRLHRRLGTTMIYVTHDQVEAMTLADRIVVLNGGSVEQVGAPLDIYRRPSNLFVASFIGSPKMNFLKAEILEKSADQVTMSLNGSNETTINIGESASFQSELVQPGRTLTLGLRPEHLSVCDQQEGHIVGDIIAVEHLGSEVFVHLDIGNKETLLFKSDIDCDFTVGSSIALSIPTQTCYLFDEDGLAI